MTRKNSSFELMARTILAGWLRHLLTVIVGMLGFDAATRTAAGHLTGAVASEIALAVIAGLAVLLHSAWSHVQASVLTKLGMWLPENATAADLETARRTVKMTPRTAILLARDPSRLITRRKPPSIIGRGIEPDPLPEKPQRRRRRPGK